MTRDIAIVIAGLLIAVAILFTFRWDISGNQMGVYRLNRWSGDVSICNISACYPLASH